MSSARSPGRSGGGVRRQQRRRRAEERLRTADASHHALGGGDGRQLQARHEVAGGIDAVHAGHPAVVDDDVPLVVDLASQRPGQARARLVLHREERQRARQHAARTRAGPPADRREAPPARRPSPRSPRRRADRAASGTPRRRGTARPPSPPSPSAPSPAASSRSPTGSRSTPARRRPGPWPRSRRRPGSGRPRRRSAPPGRARRAWRRPPRKRARACARPGRGVAQRHREPPVGELPRRLDDVGEQVGIGIGQHLLAAARQELARRLRVAAQVPVRVLDLVGAVLTRVHDDDPPAVAGEPRGGGEPRGTAPDHENVDLALDRHRVQRRTGSR